MNQPELILVAGPYRSGTNDQPELLTANSFSIQTLFSTPSY